MPKWIDAFSVRGVNETRYGQTTSSLPKEVMKEVNGRLGDIDGDVQVVVVPSGANATVLLISDISDTERKKRLEAQEEATDRVGDTISIDEANKRAKAEKEEVDGDEMRKAEAKFQEDLKSANEEEEVEEEDEHGNKRKVKKKKSRSK